MSVTDPVPVPVPVVPAIPLYVRILNVFQWLLPLVTTFDAGQPTNAVVPTQVLDLKKWSLGHLSIAAQVTIQKLP